MKVMLRDETIIEVDNCLGERLIEQGRAVIPPAEKPKPAKNDAGAPDEKAKGAKK